ncbi:hypothetical protein [Frigoribacterium sp. CFBP 8751]|uniref:hypothetical protein n=1 Tax=Frigoribacterium sp. CFBP 8751 TaxID=2775277 RepID=UPI001785D66C|nr:hypothetical protein [Frigoribacterium sp. CFBP 8751]MBD8540569.1 hypothetical protein [Frigoribacterium sp. CFBP 8751]
MPPIPGTFGVWQVRRDRAAPLGYVLSRAELGGSLNSAVAWMIQHEAELSALTGRLHPEPDEWPS